MEWRDEGILLSVRRHGESSVIIEALTAEQGRHAGLVRGGAGKRHGPILQPGAQLSLEWNARLSEHLGHYRVELIRTRAAAIMADRDPLAALNAVSALLVRLLPEREPNPEVYAATLALVDALCDRNAGWPVLYALWEMTLLDVLGFGLDLGSCASTGAREDLVYVSPRSGRAVSRAAGAPYAERLLPLPRFLLGGPGGIGAFPGPAEVGDALRLTGYFLENRVCPAFALDALPDARDRLVRLLDCQRARRPGLAAADAGARPVGNDGPHTGSSPRRPRAAAMP